MGMSAKQWVKALGAPLGVNATMNPSGKYEQWVYSGDPALLGAIYSESVQARAPRDRGMQSDFSSRSWRV